MINKNCAAEVPEPGNYTEADRRLLAAAQALLDKMRGFFADQNLHRALAALWEVVGDANRYVDEQAPWTLRKTDPKRMRTVLYVLAETIRHLAILAQPVEHGSAELLLDQLEVAED